jgi:hypothetical protein
MNPYFPVGEKINLTKTYTHVREMDNVKSTKAVYSHSIKFTARGAGGGAGVAEGNADIGVSCTHM